MYKELNGSNFDAFLAEAKVPVLVDFWAPWCGPCRMLGPVIEDVCDGYEGKVLLAKVNVDENQELASRFGVVSIPLVILFKDGKAADKSLGYIPEDEVRSFIDRNL